MTYEWTKGGERESELERERTEERVEAGYLDVTHLKTSYSCIDSSLEESKQTIVAVPLTFFVCNGFQGLIIFHVCSFL